MVGLLFVTRAGADCDVALLPARVRHRCRLGARRPRLAGADAVARPARDPRARARAPVDRLPGLRDRRAGDRRPPVRDPLRARLRGCRGAVGRLARRGAPPPHRARFGRWLVARPRERARRRAPRAPHAGAVRRHLARPLRRPVRRRGRAAARVREGRARRRAGRSRRAPRRSCGRRAVLGDHPHALARAPARRPEAAHGRRPLRALDRRLRPLARDVALAARARRRRRPRHGERRPAADDPAARRPRTSSEGG